MTFTQTDINTATILKDADEDTKVQVEESADEDIIRFDTAGTERMVINSTGVGIGTSPSHGLHIGTTTTGKNLGLYSSSYAANGLLRFYGTDGVERLQMGTLSGTSAYVYTPASTDLVMYAGGSERTRILSSGGITFNGDTASANALDDYEEGTFTPSLGGSTSNPSPTYAYQIGKYTKIGNLVTVYIYIETSNYSGGSGTLRVNGLPFTTVADVATVGSCLFYRVDSFNETHTYILSNSTSLQFQGRDTLDTSGTWNAIQTSGWSSSNPTLCIITMNYFV